MLKHVAYGVAVVLFAGTALAQTSRTERRTAGPVPQARTSSTQALLDQRVPEISFQDVPLEQVMDWVTEFTKANVVVRWEKLEEGSVQKDKPISIKVKNLRFSQVLWLIMNQAGGADTKLGYRASGNLLILSTADDLGQEMVTRVYDVSDLLVRIPRFVNPNRLDVSQALSNTGQGGGGGNNVFSSGQGGSTQNGVFGEPNSQNGANGSQNVEMTQLVQLITETVEPDSWVTSGGGRGTITPFRNQIIVHNTILVHQRLGGYLEDGD